MMYYFVSKTKPYKIKNYDLVRAPSYYEEDRYFIDEINAIHCQMKDTLEYLKKKINSTTKRKRPKLRDKIKYYTDKIAQMEDNNPELFL